MKTTDSNNNYSAPENHNCDFDANNEDYPTLTRIEEAYNEDTYNFFPDAAF